MQTSYLNKPNFSKGIKSIPLLIIMIIFSLFWFINSSIFGYLGYLTIIICTVSLLFLYKITYRELKLLIITLLILLTFKQFSGYLTHNSTDFSLYITLLVSIVISYLCINYDNTDHFIIKTIYYYIFIYASVICVLLISGKDPNNIWLGSRNLSSQLFVTYGAIFLIYRPAVDSLRFKYIFYAIIFITCLLSMGRSGIITSILLLIAGISSGYSFKLNLKSLLTYLVALFLFIYFVLNINLIINFIENYSKLEYLRNSGVDDSYRKIMINEFTNAYNINTFLVGMDLSKLPVVSSFDNNPHNSYIYLNAKLGVIAIIIYYRILILFLKLLKRRYFTEVIALTAIILRLGTDSPSAIIIIPIIFLFTYSFYVNKNF